MFYETYLLFLKLQDHLIRQKPTKNTLGDFYSVLNYRKVGLLYSQGYYKKVAKLAKDDENSITKAYYFKCLYRNGDTEKGMDALRDFLQKNSMRLVSMRGYFEEFIDDEQINNELIADRSKEEYLEMIDCISKEREQQRVFEEFASQMETFFNNKLKEQIESNAKKRRKSDKM